MRVRLPLAVAVLLIAPISTGLGLPDAPASCAPFSAPALVIPSWDATPLAADIHVPDGDGPFPLILRGHGYPNQRERIASSEPLRALVDAGFIVLAWDERGFGQSGGEVHLLDPHVEGRDVLALIKYANETWSGRSKLLRDPSGNPVVGMSGGSYGGGIQWSALVADRLLGESPQNPTLTRYIDALAPEIAWESLEESLLPGGVPKLWITTLLLGTGEVSSRTGGTPPPSDGFCPNAGGQKGLAEVYADVVFANGPTPDASSFLDQRSIATWLPEMDAVPPVFLAQGLRDTLFAPNEAVRLFEALRGRTDAKLLLHPTGHGWSGVPPEVGQDVRAFFNHTLKGDALPARWVGNDFAYAQRGLLAPAWGSDFVYTTYAAAVPPPSTLPLAPRGPIANAAAPTGYADLTFFQGRIDGEQDPGSAPTFDAPGTVAAWDVASSSEVRLVGTPRLRLLVETTSDELFLFGKLYVVDPDGRASVLYHQVMAQAVRGEAFQGPVEVAWDLASLAAVVPAGHTLRVAVSTGDVAHASSRFPGLAWIHGGEVDLPIASGP